MLRQLRRGSYSALNIFFVQQIGLDDSNLGKCLYPDVMGDYTWDSCIVRLDELPGVSNIPLTAATWGYVAIHEVGHWLGLLHVYQGDSCSGEGDLIPDTPAQRTKSSICPVPMANPWDKCAPPLGMSRNFMDVAWDLW